MTEEIRDLYAEVAELETALTAERSQREAAERERDELRKDVAFHAECRPNRREAEALRAERDALTAALADARDTAHYANGVAELAMKHRDAAEAALRANESPEAAAWKLVKPEP